MSMKWNVIKLNNKIENMKKCIENWYKMIELKRFAMSDSTAFNLIWTIKVQHIKSWDFEVQKFGMEKLKNLRLRQNFDEQM